MLLDWRQSRVQDSLYFIFIVKVRYSVKNQLYEGESLQKRGKISSAQFASTIAHRWSE